MLHPLAGSLLSSSNDIQISFFQQASITSIHGKKANHRGESCKTLTYACIMTNQYTHLQPFLSQRNRKSCFIAGALKL